MQIHSRQKPYKFKVCDQRFSQSGHLTTHMDRSLVSAKCVIRASHIYIV